MSSCNSVTTSWQADKLSRWKRARRSPGGAHIPYSCSLCLDWKLDLKKSPKTTNLSNLQPYLNHLNIQVFRVPLLMAPSYFKYFWLMILIFTLFSFFTLDSLGPASSSSKTLRRCPVSRSTFTHNQATAVSGYMSHMSPVCTGDSSQMKSNWKTEEIVNHLHFSCACITLSLNVHCTWHLRHISTWIDPICRKNFHLPSLEVRN